MMFRNKRDKIYTVKIASVMLIILGIILLVSGFIWNKIEITSENEVTKEEILQEQSKYGEGTSKSSIKQEEIDESDSTIFQKSADLKKTDEEELLALNVEEMDSESISKNEVLADSTKVMYMGIDKINLYCKVFDGVTSDNLRKGVGRFKQSANVGQSGNVCLAGHSSNVYNCVLNGIEKLKIGNTIKFYQGGNEWTYKIKSIDIISPSDIKVLRQIPEFKEVTLLTCAENGKMRRCIRGTLVE